ncbi:MAG: GNAT family N-acetyltransferase [Treponema sp.]|jgi:GNAT superfamily N-acetyltransferase|nr:GNAT family N-acetyltransferase [Treponema sp.]
MSEFRWRKMKENDASGTEALLRAREDFCVGACGRFLTRDSSKGHIWTLRGEEGKPSALILHSKSMLIPVLCGVNEIPKPRFLGGFLRKIKIHSVQGIKEEAIILENAIEQMGKKPREIIDYDLMSIDRSPNMDGFASGPSTLTLRVPKLTDLNEIAPLQAAYEQEEVLAKSSVFSPAASRVNIANIIMREHILAAELGGRLVGKINISAVSFTRYQVGGVYVHPDFRRLGIARRMASEFVGSLVAQGMGVTLFVKKTNLAAHRLYTGLGFSAREDYRISYY